MIPPPAGLTAGMFHHEFDQVVSVPNSNVSSRIGGRGVAALSSHVSEPDICTGSSPLQYWCLLGVVRYTMLREESRHEPLDDLTYVDYYLPRYAAIFG